MAGSLIERALGLLELLASDARGLPLQQLADRLDIPKSAAHRMLAELIRLGYVRQDHDTASAPAWPRWASASSRPAGWSTWSSRCSTGSPGRPANWCAWG